MRNEKSGKKEGACGNVYPSIKFSQFSLLEMLEMLPLMCQSSRVITLQLNHTAQ